jgi:peptide/nickel transport system substrate-binding protein
MFRSHRILKLIGAAVITTVALAGCAGTAVTGSTSGSKTLRLAYLGDIPAPDPDTAYASPELALVNGAYEGLIAYQSGVNTAKLEPVLATDWKVDSTNTVFTFDLRKGVTFHDGTPFDASAVKASFDRRTAVNQGPAYMVAGVKSVDAPTDHQVVITLKDPNSAFLAYLASPFGPKMMSPTQLKAHAANNGTDYFDTHDAGTGAYEFGTFKKGTSYSLKAYPKYWGAAPKYTNVDFTVVSNISTVQLEIEGGQLDGIVGFGDKQSLASYKTNSALNTYEFPSLQTPTLFLNPKSAAFTSQATRVSLLSGLDFPSIASKSLGSTGKSTTEVFPPTMIDAAGDQQTIAHSASALSGLASGALSGTSLKIGYMAQSPAGQALAENIAAELNTAKISAKTISYPNGTFYSSMADPATAPDMAILTGYPDTAHPDSWARIFYTPKGGLDLYGTEIPGVEAQLDAMLVSGDPAGYSQVAKEVSASGYFYSLATVLGTAVLNKSVTGADKAWNLVVPDLLDLKLLAPKA